MIDPERLLERFLRYVRVETTADPSTSDYPSSPGQLDLGRIVAADLRDAGAADAMVDPHGLVHASLPPTSGCEHAPTVALIAHLDTSPEASGRDVRPRVIRDYDGGDITLESGEVIEAAGVPGLSERRGGTVVVTDGRTLLGGDDKCGVAIIVETVAALTGSDDATHGPVRVLMTCDEEIGRGTDRIDVPALNAAVAYTLDGGGRDVIDVETFSADGAVVRFTGRNIHPSIGKGRMVNAVRAAADFVAALDRDATTPETTDARDGFIHPYEIEGGVGEVTVRLILRSFDDADLTAYADTIRDTARRVAAAIPGVNADVVVSRQYRNMAAGLRKLPAAVELPLRAAENLGRPFKTEIIRGGTDGSGLTEKGLPTPNLSSGQYNIHSTGEVASLDDMTAAAEHLIETLRLWSEQSAP